MFLQLLKGISSLQVIKSSVPFAHLPCCAQAIMQSQPLIHQPGCMCQRGPVPEGQAKGQQDTGKANTSGPKQSRGPWQQASNCQQEGGQHQPYHDAATCPTGELLEK